MNVMDVIYNTTKLHHKKPTVSAKQIIKLLRTNQYDPTNMVHNEMLKVAQRQGYIDKDLNIIKEV